MAQNSSIEWTDATWNPTRGCTKIAQGCKHCYAETFAERWRGVPGHAYERGFDPREAPDQLGVPLTWKRGRRIFVDSMSDLFHEDFSFRYIAAVFGVMASCPQHTFQILTKRPERAAEFFRWIARQVAVGLECAGTLLPIAVALGCGNQILGIGSLPVPKTPPESWQWPLSNVWIGTSIARQPDADANIGHLRDIPAVVRFLSIEPLIAPVDISRWLWSISREHGARLNAIHWVIVGGESGPGARPMHPDWARSLRDQCNAAGVPYLFKQWGSHVAVYDRDVDDPDWRNVPEPKKNEQWLNLAGGQGFHGDRLVLMRRVDKKAAGRILDGRTWDEFPEVAGA